MARKRTRDVLIDAAIRGGIAALGGLTTAAILADFRAAILGTTIAFGLGFLLSVASARRL